MLIFPKLELLAIRGCPKLKRIPNSCFPSSKVLIINDLDSSSMISGMSRTFRDTDYITDQLLRNNSPSLTLKILEEQLKEQ